MPLGDAVLPWLLGEVLLCAGELDEAAQTLKEAAETTSLARVRAYAMDSLGVALYRQGQIQAARENFRQALEYLVQFKDLRGCASAVEQLGCIAGVEERWERAAQLLGAAEMLFDLSSRIPFPPWQLQPEEIGTACQRQLGPRSYTAALTTGRAMSFNRAVQYALESDQAVARSGRVRARQVLTKREREISILVAEGLSNRRIAEALHISEKTVETHLSHVLAKLELPSRTRLAVWAAEQGLLRSEVQDEEITPGESGSHASSAAEISGIPPMPRRSARR